MEEVVSVKDLVLVAEFVGGKLVKLAEPENKESAKLLDEWIAEFAKES